MDILLTGEGKPGLPRIRPLWERLNAIHEKDSLYWKARYAAFTFDERMKDIAEVPETDFKLTIARADGEPAGYCLSTIHGSKGEIESLYLDERLRSRHLGATLVDSHLAWFKSRGCGKIVVTVAHGHESVLPFYNKLGFFERLIELELDPSFGGQ